MDAVFQRFDSYDFAADRRFADGLKTLKSSEGGGGGGGGDAERVLDLKLFFYNRFVEPIDRCLYRQQRPSRPPASLPGCNAATEAPEAVQLSFAEVMRLVQEGKEVPGVTRPDVQPSNRSPTPSRMTRTLKPWETAVTAAASCE